jgi:REP element-mobilizing transposase RayT
MKLNKKEWRNRGYIPHFDSPGTTQFVTFRLADSMPQSILPQWRAELQRGAVTDVDFRKRIESYLDQNFGSCVLRQRSVAKLVQESLLHWNDLRYRLVAWVIMPNHVHFLARIEEGFSLSDIMHSIKSMTAHSANTLLGRAGTFWAKESFDRFIRDENHFQNVISYIEMNPVKAKLCQRPQDWTFGSAYYVRQKPV